MVYAYTSGLSRLALIHVLLIEPILIFAYIYIMIITLENHHVTDFTVVTVLVLGISVLMNTDDYKKPSP